MPKLAQRLIVIALCVVISVGSVQNVPKEKRQYGLYQKYRIGEMHQWFK